MSTPYMSVTVCRLCARTLYACVYPGLEITSKALVTTHASTLAPNRTVPAPVPAPGSQGTTPHITELPARAITCAGGGHPSEFAGPRL